MSLFSRPKSEPEFTRIEKSSVKSSKGFSVRQIDRNKWVYSEEDGHSLNFDTSASVDGRFGRVTVVFLDTITGWLAPHMDETLSTERRGEIARNIGRALLFLEELPIFH